MAIQKPTLPKGTRDFGPADVQKRKYILNTIETVFKKYGFMPLETPTMENLTTLEGKYGDEGDKLLFRILESGDFFSKTSNEVSQLTHYLFQSIRYVTYFLYVDKSEYNIPRIQITGSTTQEELRDWLHKYYAMIVRSFGIEGLKLDKKIREDFFDKIVSQALNQLNNLLYGFYQGRLLQIEKGSGKKQWTKEDIDFEINYTIFSKYNELFEIVDKIYNHKTVKNNLSEKGLRYDLTVPFARYVVMNRNEITFPFKRYQMQPVWRADRPQKGRYREFWQCDADVVGSDSLLNELDLIQIYAEAFTKLGINNYEIKINNRKVLAGIAQVVKSIDVMNTIAIAIDKLDKIGVDGVSKELTEQGFSQTELNTLFDIITIKGENQTILNQLKNKLQASEEGLKGIEELAFILASNPNQNINLTLDFSLARGLSYYTGCIFEVVSNDGTLKSSIGGGGRYDNLTGIFGLPNVSGVGISFGLDRIYDVMDELKLFPEQLRATSTQVLFCHFDEASQQYCLPAAKALRDAGIASEIYPDVVKKKAIAKQLDYANALQIPFAAIAGETEVEQGIFNLKNLVTGEQKAVTLTELIGTFVSA